MLKKAFVYFFVVATLFLAGCASPMRAPPEQDSLAKNFTTANDTASLYIYRNENFGGAVGMLVKVNGIDIGETGAKTFFKLNLKKGSYVISSEAENVSELPLTLVEGVSYFIWQEVKMGIWKARNSLKQVDESTGKSGVLESQLLAPRFNDETISKSATKKD